MQAWEGTPNIETGRSVHVSTLDTPIAEIYKGAIGTARGDIAVMIKNEEFEHEKGRRSSEPTFEEIPYFKQGDESFNTPRHQSQRYRCPSPPLLPDAFDTLTFRSRRQSLRESQELQRLVLLFWNTYESVKKTGKLAKDEAIHVDILMCKALFEDDLFDEIKVEAIALSDWERENEGALEESENDYISRMNEVWYLKCVF